MGKSACGGEIIRAWYQLLENSTIPTVNLPNDAGTLRVIAGDYAGQHGPARTFTEMDVWDLRLRAGKTLGLVAKANRNAGLIVLHGSIYVDSRAPLNAGELMILDGTDTTLLLDATEDAVVLFLSGEPIDEPVVGYGPFVMNSEQEIRDAVDDFNNGSFGKIPAALLHNTN